jgi:hypothetical protein
MSGRFGLDPVFAGLPPVLAQAAPDGSDFLRRVGNSFEAFSARQPAVAIVLAAGAAAVLAAAVLYFVLQPVLTRRRQVREWYDGLARAHGLGEEHRAALERLAARAGLDHPSFLFVQRGLFERHARELSPDLADDLRTRLYG